MHEGLQGSGGLIPHILNLGTSWMCVVTFMIHDTFEQEAGWASEPAWEFWKRDKFLRLPGIESCAVPPVRQSVYRLHFFGSRLLNWIFKKQDVSGFTYHREGTCARLAKVFGGRMNKQSMKFFSVPMGILKSKIKY